MVRSGEVTWREARAHRLRHVLTRYLGTSDAVIPELRVLRWKPGDCMMLCSDGLTSMLEEKDILKVLLKEQGNLQTSTEKLVALANRRGGKDNISVILISWN